MRRSLLLFVVLLVAGPLLAQGLMQRKRPDIIPLDGKARRGGFYVAPGVTYTLTRFKDAEEEVFRNGDTTYSATFDPNGRLGLYLEAGWFYATRDPIILDYWDVGLAYKNLRGNERYSGLWSHAVPNDPDPPPPSPPPQPPQPDVPGPTPDPPPPPDPPGPSPDDPELLGAVPKANVVTDSTQGEGSFAERWLTFHVNANKFIQLRDYQFLQLSVGANLDYRLGSSYSHEADPVLHAHVFPPDLVGQVHVKVGYGFKVTGNLLIIPALEVPVFSIMPEDQGFGQLQWFSSRYRPMILSVRFLWLRARKGFACPPPIRHNEFEKGRTKQYKPDSYHP